MDFTTFQYFDSPIMPFVRHANLAVRNPWLVPVRRLFDYLLLYVQEGHCLVVTGEHEHHLFAGDFCFIQPNELHSIQGITKTVTLYVHFDIFYNADRDKCFFAHPDISHHAHMIQPLLNDFAEFYIPVKLLPSNPVLLHDILLKLIEIGHDYDTLNHIRTQQLTMEMLLFIFRDYYKSPVVKSSKPMSLN